MPYFAHWKSNKQEKKFGNQAFNENSDDKLVVANISEIWNKNLKRRLNLFRLLKLMSTFFQKFFVKMYKNCFKIYYLNPVSNIPSA